MDEYKILYQGMLGDNSSEAAVYTCPPVDETSVESGTVVVNPKSASTVTQTYITSIVVCSTRSSGGGNVTMFLYPDAATFTSNGGEATYALVYLKPLLNKTFMTLNLGLYMSPGSVLTAKAYLANSLSLNICGIETRI